MADYYPVLTRAISGLDPNTAEARRAVYERARQAIVRQLRSYDPPLSESEITKERLGLEEAVRRIEAEHKAAAQPLKEPAGAERPLSPAPGAMAPRPSAPPPSPPSPRVAASEGLVKLHAAAAAAASLGAATANAQVSASTTQAAFDPPPPRAVPRLEPNFERPRVPGPLPEPRAQQRVSPFAEVGDEDPNPHLREPDDELPDAPRAPKIAGIAAVVVLLGLGIGAYLARDTISGLFGADEAPVVATDSGPKVEDRVGTGEPVPGAPANDIATAPAPDTAAAPSEPATEPPAAPADAGGLVGQRATLYDEAPDQQSGAALSSGSVVWRTEPVPNNPNEVQLVGEISIPERNLSATLTMTRNLDNTLPASHLIEIAFTTPEDFANGGVGNVPGILFKETEADGGSALKGMSAKVTKNMFLIGLEQTPADREQNMQAIRNRGWIDLPILYENGRRAVLTIEKGPPGERAFETAFAAWETTPAAQVPPAQ